MRATSKVDAEGKLDSSAVLAASTVVFHDSLRFQSAATNVARVNGTDLRNGTFQLLDGTLTVHASDVTAFDSGVADLSAVDARNVEVRGYPTVAGGKDIVATRVRLGTGGGDPSTRVVIQGPIGNVDAAARTFDVLGYTIDGAGAMSVSRDGNPLSNDSAVVFTNLANGTVVKARADTPSALSGTTLVAKELDVEDDR